MSDKKTVKVRRVTEGDLVKLMDNIVNEKVAAAKTEWIAEQNAKQAGALTESMSKLVEAKVAAILGSTKK
tara:strand:+ start:129 stop:338 length:210 start_codon:yes stop_codon:yes gene_type:complete